MLVASDVLVQIRLLGERLMTPKLLTKWAGEGPLPGVDPEVVVEVVPLPEA